MATFTDTGIVEIIQPQIYGVNSLITSTIEVQPEVLNIIETSLNVSTTIKLNAPGYIEPDIGGPVFSHSWR